SSVAPTVRRWAARVPATTIGITTQPGTAASGTPGPSSTVGTIGWPSGTPIVSLEPMTSATVTPVRAAAGNRSTRTSVSATVVPAGRSRAATTTGTVGGGAGRSSPSATHTATARQT